MPSKSVRSAFSNEAHRRPAWAAVCLSFRTKTETNSEKSREIPLSAIRSNYHPAKIRQSVRILRRTALAYGEDKILKRRRGGRRVRHHPKDKKPSPSENRTSRPNMTSHHDSSDTTETKTKAAKKWFNRRTL